MKKILFLTVTAVFFATTACREVKDPDFKSDDTPRWETGSTVQLNETGAYVFITDAGGALFSSAKYKTGRISPDGADYEMVEFDGSPALGKASGPSLRKPSGSVALHSLEIVKMEGGKLWIVFKETATSAERRIVQ